MEGVKENLEEKQDRSERHDSEYVMHNEELRSLEDYLMKDKDQEKK